MFQQLFKFIPALWFPRWSWSITLLIFIQTWANSPSKGKASRRSFSLSTLHLKLAVIVFICLFYFRGHPLYSILLTCYHRKGKSCSRYWDQLPSEHHRETESKSSLPYRNESMKTSSVIWLHFPTYLSRWLWLEEWSNVLNMPPSTNCCQNPMWSSLKFHLYTGFPKMFYIRWKGTILQIETKVLCDNGCTHIISGN